MTHNEDDDKFLGKIDRDIKPFSNSLKSISDYMANCNKNTKIALFFKNMFIIIKKKLIKISIYGDSA